MFRQPLHRVHRSTRNGLAVVVSCLLGVLVAGAVVPARAQAATITISAVGTLITHTNQPSSQQESVSVAPSAVGDVLAVVVETKFPGTPSFTASGISGGGVTTWHLADSFLTVDGFHGTELWWGTVTQAGPSTLTVSYTAPSTAGTSESATSVDVQEFASSAGTSTVWSVDKTGRDDTGTAATTLNYPTLSPTSPPEVYFGYLAVPGSVNPGSTPGVVYQTDARYNQVAYDVSVTDTITPTVTSSSQTYISIGMLLIAGSGSTTPDITAPSVPTGLAVSGTPTASSVALTWTAATDDAGGSGVAGYRIYRNGATTPLNSTLVTTTSYTDTTVAASTSYSYTVAAVDNAGNQSATSAAVAATTSTPTPTPTPTTPAPAPGGGGVNSGPSDAGGELGGSGATYFLNTTFGPVADQVFTYGDPSDSVFVGDWNGDGTDTLMVRRGNVFFVRNSNTPGVADSSFAYGDPGDTVLVGDWDGDGKDSLAIRRGNTYYIRNSLSTGVAETVLAYGDNRDAVLVGDWNGDHQDTLAIRRGAQYLIRNELTTGVADETVTYGDPGDTVLVGHWSTAQQGDSLAVRRGNSFYFRYSLSSGTADRVVAYGDPTDTAFRGDWNGQGIDTLGVRRAP
ncbi:MAG: barrel protein [Modestobacter sp.]|nr:barrel protein [Modestobacter sp.]